MHDCLTLTRPKEMKYWHFWVAMIIKQWITLFLTIIHTFLCQSYHLIRLMLERHNWERVIARIGRTINLFKSTKMDHEIILNLFNILNPVILVTNKYEHWTYSISVSELRFISLDIIAFCFYSCQTLFAKENVKSMNFKSNWILCFGQFQPHSISKKTKKIKITNKNRKKQTSW